MTTHWDQGSNYNELCPWDASVRQRSVTGCVATTMAQIMRYWSYPARGTGSHTYNSPYGSLTANFN
ncbi:C10 family peptidase, partial [Pseudomonas aeruginosa]|uniref:C10 family peptidase n=1 Tax=Pseudomonas aeruginosa TaxID=287 RepID=UPI003C6DFBAA